MGVFGSNKKTTGEGIFFKRFFFASFYISMKLSRKMSVSRGVMVSIPKKVKYYGSRKVYKVKSGPAQRVRSPQVSAAAR